MPVARVLFEQPKGLDVHETAIQVAGDCARGVVSASHSLRARHRRRSSTARSRNRVTCTIAPTSANDSYDLQSNLPDASPGENHVGSTAEPLVICGSAEGTDCIFPRSRNALAP